jgi:capsular polysaccharide biosynthesis protein
MPLTEYFRILSRRGWIILLLAALTAASAFVFSTLQTPIYKSTVYVGVLPARPDLGLTQSAKTLLRLYVSVINTETYAQKVIEAKKMDRTPGDLLGDVTIASDDSRFVIQIDVKDPSPAEANDIALKWAEFFIQWRRDQNAAARREDRVEAFVLDPPRPALDQPKRGINTLAGAILGGLLGGVIIFVLEYRESGIIRSPQDVDRTLGLSVLGAIPALEGSRRRG